MRQGRGKRQEERLGAAGEEKRAEIRETDGEQSIEEKEERDISKRSETDPTEPTTTMPCHAAAAMLLGNGE